MSSSSTKGDPPHREWNLPPELEREALYKCEEGKFIVCRTCNKHNPETNEREKKGSISVSQPFWYYAFKENVQSKYHSANVRRKEFFETEQYKELARKGKLNPFFQLGSLEDLGAKLLVQTKFLCILRQE
jgi:hypothetical protein